MALYKQFYEDGVPMGKPQNPKLANPAPEVVRPKRIGVKRGPGNCPEGPQNTRGFQGISSILSITRCRCSVCGSRPRGTSAGSCWRPSRPYAARDVGSRWRTGTPAATTRSPCSTG